MNKPLSRNEAILQNMLGADNELLPPESRIEALLQQLLEALQAGGGSITVDTELSETSTHPVENKAVTAAINLLKSVQFGTISGITPNTNTGSMEIWSGDLNKITTSGFYNAITCKNAPSQYLNLLVIGYYLTGYCSQIAIDVTTGNINKRMQINGTWQAWESVTYVDSETKKY